MLPTSIPKSMQPKDDRGRWWMRFAILLCSAVAAVSASYVVLASDRHNDERYVNETDITTELENVADNRYVQIKAAEQDRSLWDQKLAAIKAEQDRQFAEVKSNQATASAQVSSQMADIKTDLRTVLNVLLDDRRNRTATPNP